MAARWFTFRGPRNGYYPSNEPLMPGLQNAKGVRYNRGSYVKRPGSSQFLDKPTSSAISSLLRADFASGAIVLRCEHDNVRYGNVGAGTWDDVLAAGYTYSTNESDRWRGAMIFDDWYMSQGTRFSDLVPNLTNDGILTMDEGGNTMTGVTNSPGAKDLVSFAGRLIALHVHDSDSTVYPYRFIASDAGVPTDFYTNGVRYNLVDDGFPIQRGIVVGGRMWVLKGSQDGGSIVVCTPTGSATTPFATETIYGTGILGDNTLARVGESRAVFLGHDNFYEIIPGDVRPIVGDEKSQAVVDKMLETVDRSRIEDAFSQYFPEQGEIWVSIPVSSNFSELYVLDLRTDTWTGPDDSSTYTDAVFVQSTAPDSWSRTSLSDFWVGGDDGTWLESVTEVGAPATLIALNEGTVLELDPALPDENSASIPILIETEDLKLENEPFIIAPRTRAPKFAGAYDRFFYDALVIRYKDQGSLSLVVSVSTDSGSGWTEVFNDTIMGAGDGAVVEKFITFAQQLGSVLRVRIEHDSSTEDFEFVSVAARVSLAGPRRT